MNANYGHIFYSPTGTLQITLNGPGCYYRKQDYCKMCNYGGNNTITLLNAVQFVDDAIKQHPQASRILIGSNGSILDEREISRSIVSAALSRIHDCSIKDIYIETHVNTITKESLKYLKSELPTKNITIEMGLESSNAYVLQSIINKDLDLSIVRESIELIHNYNMRAALNVIYGLWYDEASMQADFIDTCYWASTRKADEIIVFLLHIKPGTLVYDWYIDGKISPPSHRDFIEILPLINDEVLQKMYFSWYGEREEAINSDGIIPPSYDDLEQEKVMRFYYDFMRSSSGSERSRLIYQFIHNH
ncbi:hypothetical protein IKG54_00705 [Candidatus Saccharibacteria bacterium]|nr:hypothetical protein [Candidatus Saccharibacteria bacterium]